MVVALYSANSINGVMYGVMYGVIESGLEKIDGLGSESAN